MKLKKLEPNQAEKLKCRFHDHPLLLTCQSAFHHYMADMSQFDFTSEDMFVVTADVIDAIFEEPADAPQYIESLWDNIKIELKKKAHVTPPQEDLNVVCKVLFYVVAATLSLHWKGYYRTEIVKLLYDEVRKKKQFDDVEEQQKVVANLCSHAEILEDWINRYEDSGEWLSDEIAEALANEQDETPPYRNINIFDIKLNEDVIVTTIQDMNKRGLGEINFVYAIHSFFESVHWLSDMMDTKFVSWMKSHGLMTIGANNLKQANPKDSRVVGLIEELHTIFQETHPYTGKKRDKLDFYLPGKKRINSGE